MKRLFFGLALDLEVGASLLRTVRRSLSDAPAFQSYGEDDLHLTLCFLGAVDDATLPSLTRCAQAEFRGMLAPELRVGGEAGAFPSRDRPRALWAAASEGMESNGRLAALRNRALQVGLSHGCRPSASELTRAFEPHVTVARAGSGAGFGSGGGSVSGGSGPGASGIPGASGAPGDSGVPEDFWDLGSERAWLPIDVTLFESTDRTDEGAPVAGDRYRPVAAWPLIVRPG